MHNIAEQEIMRKNIDERINKIKERFNNVYTDKDLKISSVDSE